MFLKVLFVFAFVAISVGHRRSEDLSRSYVESSCMLQNSPHSNGWKSVAQLSRYYEADKQFEVPYCIIKGRDNEIKATGIFEIFASRFPPDEIDFLTDSKLALKLRNSIIVTSYENHSDSREEAGTQLPKVSAIYVCKEIEGLRIAITGVPSKVYVRKSTVSDPVEGYWNIDEQATDQPCADFTEEPDPTSSYYRRLGTNCLMRNGKHGRLVWVDGNVDCLWCCSGHHWDRIKRQCQLCPPGQHKPEPHSFHYCLQKHDGEQSDLTTLV